MTEGQCLCWIMPGPLILPWFELHFPYIDNYYTNIISVEQHHTRNVPHHYHQHCTVCKFHILLHLYTSVSMKSMSLFSHWFSVGSNNSTASSSFKVHICNYCLCVDLNMPNVYVETYWLESSHLEWSYWYVLYHILKFYVASCGWTKKTNM